MEWIQAQRSTSQRFLYEKASIWVVTKHFYLQTIVPTE